MKLRGATEWRYTHAGHQLELAICPRCGAVVPRNLHRAGDLIARHDADHDDGEAWAELVTGLLIAAITNDHAEIERLAPRFLDAYGGGAGLDLAHAMAEARAQGLAEQPAPGSAPGRDPTPDTSGRRRARR